MQRPNPWPRKTLIKSRALFIKFINAGLRNSHSCFRSTLAQNSWALPRKKWKNTHKKNIRSGRTEIHRDQAIVKRYNRTLAKRLFGHQYAVEMRLPESQRYSEWVARLPALVSALSGEVTRLTGKKPVAAINVKAVYSKPSTPYDRPFGVREKMARQSLLNLETTPSADPSSRRFHSLCTSRSYAFPKRRSACHTSCSPKLEYLGKQCLLWILIAVPPVLRDFVHEEREDFLRNIINGSVNSCNFQPMVEIPFQQRHLQHDLLGWKGANLFSLVVHGFAFAVRQVVFHVLRYSLACNWFVVKQRRHFFELRP